MLAIFGGAEHQGLGSMPIGQASELMGGVAPARRGSSESFTRWLRIPEQTYRWFSSIGGIVTAHAVILGLLALRRTTVPRVRATTSGVGWIALILPAIVIVLGIIPTMGVNLLGSGHDYRQNVALWFRARFAGNPDVAAIAHAPLIYQVHATAAWAILAPWNARRRPHC